MPPPISEQDFNAIESLVTSSAPMGASQEELDRLVDEAVARHVKSNRGLTDVAGGLIKGGFSALGSGLRGVKTAAQTAIGTGVAAAGGEQAMQKFLATDPGIRAVKDTASGIAGLAGGVGSAIKEGVSRGELPWESPHAIAAGYKNPQLRALADEYAGRYGSWEKTKDTFYERPFDMLTDVASIGAPALRGASVAATAAKLPRVARALEVASGPINAGNKALATRIGGKLDDVGFSMARMSMGLNKADALNNPLHVNAIATQRANNYIPTVSGVVNRRAELELGQAEKGRVLARAERRGVEAPNWQHNQRRQVGEYMDLDANSPQRAQGAEKFLKDFNEGALTSTPTTKQVPGPWNPATRTRPMVTVPGTPAPKTHIPIADQNQLLNDAANLRNHSAQFGMDTDFMDGPAKMADARWKDLREAQDYAVPDVKPINDKLSDLHGWIGTVTAKRLRQGDAFSTYPTPKAQAAGLLSRGLGAGEAMTGHVVDAIGSGFSGFGGAPRGLSRFAPQAITAGNAFSTMNAAAPQQEPQAQPAPPGFNYDDVLSRHKSGGSSTSLSKGNLRGQPGFAVGAYPEQNAVVDSLDRASLEEYVQRNQALLQDPENSLGTWLDDDPQSATYGKTHLDISRTLADREAALQLAREKRQKAIFDLASGEEIDLPGMDSFLGGTGRGLGRN